MLHESPPPIIRAESCTGCRLCVAACPSFVLRMESGTAIVAHGERCIGCGHCGAICPADAVTPSAAAEQESAAASGGPALTAEAVHRLIRERRSVRLYRTEPVSRDLLESLLDAGRYAPTGTNSQNVTYVVFTKREEIDELRRRVLAFYEKLFTRVRSRLGAFLLSLAVGRKTVERLRGYVPIVGAFEERLREGDDRLLYNAPAVVLVHAESWDTCSAFNCAAALYTCSLKAPALGLGTCFNGFVEAAAANDRGIREYLGIPRENRCFGAMTVGHPAAAFRRLVARNEAHVTWR